VQINLDDLRRHYASLTDEALRAIDRSELVDMAQRGYDEELARREPAPGRKSESLAGPSVRVAPLDQPHDDEAESGFDVDTGEKPPWLEEAACACTFATFPGSNTADVENARDVLQNAGIPCYLALREIDPPSVTPQPQYEYRVMVPGGLNLQAASVLDKEIFNLEIEAEWKAHFEALSDEELLAVKKEVLFGGLLDRVERVTRAYDEELARRKKS
jgi:hypothetical protein